jgi:6-phospho-beta-galactosidase
LVTLHHFTHPAWLGEDFWLELDAPERYADWVTTAVDRLGESCTSWVTVNEPNIWALQTYLTGDFPPGRLLSIGHVVRALDHLLAAHVLGHAAVKARQPDSTVSTNTFTFSLYELDRLLVDLLLARHHRVRRDELRPWLVSRRDEFETAIEPFSGPERLVRLWARTAIPLELAFPRTVSEVYASPHERSLDVVQLDHYDPVVSNHIRLPGHRTAGGRWWQPSRPLWDDPPDPAGFSLFTTLAAADGLPVWIVENGLCNRVRRGRSYPRLDGWDRPRYLRAHLGAVVRLLRAGVPVEGYWHWTLADNYEWGSYEPRFGLYGVDRERGGRWLDTDSLGDDSVAEYRRLASEVRAAAEAAPPQRA